MNCPNETILTLHPSQGAAVMHNVISSLNPKIKEKVIAGVLWGDTKNKQSNGQIDGYSKDQTLILCTPDDGVCWGRLEVTAGHLAYLKNGDEERSVKWLKGKIDAAVAARGGVVPVKIGRRKWISW
jgi:cutinase